MNHVFIFALVLLVNLPNQILSQENGLKQAYFLTDVLVSQLQPRFTIMLKCQQRTEFYRKKAVWNALLKYECVGWFAFLCADLCGFHNKIQVWIILKRYLLDMSVRTSAMRLYLHKIIKPRSSLRIEIFTTMLRNVSGVFS